MTTRRNASISLFLCFLSHAFSWPLWVPSVHSQGRRITESNLLLFESSNVNGNNNDNLQYNRTADLEAKYARLERLHQAQAKIDAILNGDDPPFDLEAEVRNNVVSIAPPVISPGSPEHKVDQQVAELEEELYQSVQQQDFAKAAQKAAEISQWHVDDCAAVLQRNQAFYQAFSDKNYSAMQAVWLADNTCVCIHPGHLPLVGNKHVLESWQHMFDHSPPSATSWIHADKIRLSVKGTVAVVTCTETVHVRRFVRGQMRQTEQTNQLLATNLFRKVGGQWYLTHHHASAHPETLQPGNNQDKKNILWDNLLLPPRPPGAKGLKPPQDSFGLPMNQDSSSSNPRTTTGSSTLDATLGIPGFGPIVGNTDKNQDDDSKSTNGKKIIMGSLSDLLNFGDPSAKSDNPEILNLGDGGKAIIKFSKMMGPPPPSDKNSNKEGYFEVDDDEDEDDDDETEVIDLYEEDDDEEDTDEDDDKDDSSSTSPSSSTTRSKDRWGESSTTSPRHPKDVLRQNCITALRRLADQGRISQKQKRALLTDIITCSAKGEFSMVEVAYELLCNEGTRETPSADLEELAEEEFADQCRVFADGNMLS